VFCCCLADLFWHQARRLIFIGRTIVEPGGFRQWVNVWFLHVRSRKSEVGRKKLTEHEVTAGAAPAYYNTAATKVP